MLPDRLDQKTNWAFFVEGVKRMAWFLEPCDDLEAFAGGALVFCGLCLIWLICVGMTSAVAALLGRDGLQGLGFR